MTVHANDDALTAPPTPPPKANPPASANPTISHLNHFLCPRVRTLEGFTSISLLSIEISFLTSAKSLISSCDFNGKVVSFVQLTKRKAKQQTPDKIILFIASST